MQGERTLQRSAAAMGRSESGRELGERGAQGWGKAGFGCHNTTPAPSSSRPGSSLWRGPDGLLWSQSSTMVHLQLCEMGAARKELANGHRRTD